MLYPVFRSTCVSAPLWGKEGISVRSRKSGVCWSSSETMFVSEELVEPVFCTSRVKSSVSSRICPA